MLRFRMRSVEALAQSMDDGNGPRTAGALLADLIERLTDHVGAQVQSLEERADKLEEISIADPGGAHRKEVSDQRLELTELRRYMGPQHEAVRGIARSDVDWLSEAHLRKIEEQLDQITRVGEALEATREQLQAIRDEIEGTRAERLNRTSTCSACSRLCSCP